MKCQNCGGFVTKDFARVFGNGENEAHGCFRCKDKTEIKNGGAVA